MTGFLKRWATGTTGGPESSWPAAPTLAEMADPQGATPAQVLPEPTPVELTPTLLPTAVVPEATPSGSRSEAVELPLKGHAIELWCDHAGGRVFIVADEADAREVIRRFGARRGEVWIPAEIELVGRIEDQAIRDEVADFKRQIDGRLSLGDGGEADAGEAVPAAEQKASMLNELFRTRGVTGQPGRIAAATIRHGERKAAEKEL